jgi:hypothetical protein
VVLLVALGGLFIALGLPMAMRWVPRNRWYGLRVPQTLEDDRMWYPANARSGLDLIALGVAAVAGGFLLSTSALTEEHQVITGGAVIVAGLLLIAIRGFLHARKLARALSRAS